MKNLIEIIEGAVEGRREWDADLLLVYEAWLKAEADVTLAEAKIQYWSDIDGYESDEHMDCIYDKARRKAAKELKEAREFVESIEDFSDFREGSFLEDRDGYILVCGELFAEEANAV